MKPAKALTGLAITTTVIISLVVILPIAAALYLAWQLHPWVPAGRSLHISDQHLEDYDSQVWQRKNTSIVEPFTTGLFIRKQGNQWHGFWIGFEDSYHPKIWLERERSGLSVIVDGEIIGFIDEKVSTFSRKSDGYLFPADVTNSEPPGKWWLK